ncbi:type I-F CRISPR-associated endoribonuclease Cas6/Csy4, partial [Vibrio sp. FNV 38]|nr:type I-F CRISPR-associated endoribonuclease Cas6/Csy4 [Vibrio sp. FNV 38]
MNKRYYFYIRYLPEQADCGLLAGRCISQMHKFMVNN